MNLFRWHFWLRRSRYWKKKCRAVEARYAQLMISAEAERWRNLAREDTLVTVPMRMAGLWGMPAREGPALKQISSPPRALTQSTDPWDALSWADKQEYDIQWKEAAAAQGIPEHTARQQFLAEIQNRRIPINDEPFS